MDSVVELLNLDRSVFRDWVNAERSRLPGSSSGFASFLAVLRMLRPVEVVWVSDGREPEQCGYATSSVGRLIVEILSVGSRLVWLRSEGEHGLVSHEFRGADGLGPGSPLVILSIPEGYELRLAGISGGLVVRRSVSEWDFFWAVPSEESSSEGGAVEGDSSYLFGSESEDVSEYGGRTGDTRLGDSVEDGGGGAESGDTATSTGRRRKARRSGRD